MLAMAKINIIRDDYFREGLNISEISRSNGIDRKTARKYVMAENWNNKPLYFSKNKSKLDPYKALIDSWIEEDCKRRRKQRHTAQRIHNRLCDEIGENFDCSYRTVAAYVSLKRKEIFKINSMALPLQHKAGEAQADFGQADYIENGKLVNGHYLILSLPYSNGGYIQLFKGENTECLLEGLIAEFTHIGKVPNRIWFDNASTIVTSVLKDGKRILTDRFLRFQQHFGFEAAFCNPASGNEKGHVENKVGYLRRNLLVPIPEFDNLTDFNKELLKRCDTDHKRPHYRKEISIETLIKDDKTEMLELPRIPFDPATYRILKTDAYAIFSLTGGKHRYGTAPKYAGTEVTVKITAHSITALDESLREIVTHPRFYGNQKQEVIDWMLYLNQLSRRPAAVKYTPIYDMMPEELCLWLDKQKKSDVGSALKLISGLAGKSSFDSACKAVSESIKSGITDADSLTALHDRMYRYTPFMSGLSNSKDNTIASGVRFNPSKYDSMLERARS